MISLILIISGSIATYFGFREMKKLNTESLPIESPNKFDTIDPSNEIEEQWKNIAKLQTGRFFIGGVGMIICGIAIIFKSNSI